MNCEKFWKRYEDGGMTPDLENHLRSCESCRRKMEAETLLLSTASNMPSFTAPDGLWEKIEAVLPEEHAADTTAEARRSGLKVARGGIFARLTAIPFKPVLSVAAVVLITIFATHYYHVTRWRPIEMVKLRLKATDELEAKEQDYLAAISKLSRMVEEKKDAIEPELFDLYSEKLTVLDEYIADCREAVESNEYSINAREYLALAYREKVSTLKEMSELL